MTKTLNLLYVTLALALGACTQSPTIIITDGGGGGRGGGGGAGGGDYCSSIDVICVMYLTQPGAAGDASGNDADDASCESCTEGQVCADNVCVDGDEVGGDSHK